MTYLSGSRTATTKWANVVSADRTLTRGTMRRISVVLVLVIGIGRPIAAQTVTWPFADFDDTLESRWTVHRTGGGNRSTAELMRVSPVSTVVTADSRQGETSTSDGSAQDQASAASGPITSLGALSSRVKPADRIYVRSTSGEKIEGLFSHASPVSLTLEVEGRMRDIPAADVQQVWQRGASQAKRGMLFGFLAGAAIADIAALTASSSESDWSTRDKILLGTLAGGGAGLIWGGLIGAFIHERNVVYLAAPTVRVMPLLAPGRAGVMLAARF